MLAGVVSAAMNVAAAIGGPAIALYAGNADWPATAMRSTAQIYFVGLNVVALVSLGVPHVTGGLMAGWRCWPGPAARERWWRDACRSRRPGG